MAEPKCVFHMPRYKRVEFEEEDSGRTNYSPDAIGFGNPNATSLQFVSPPEPCYRLDFAGSTDTMMPDKMMVISDPGDSVNASNRTTNETTHELSARDISDSGLASNSGGGTKVFTVRKSSVIINKGRLRIRTFWDRASPVEKLLFILLVSVTLFSSFLIIAFARNYHSFSSLYDNASDVCLTKECVTIASTIINSIDPKINPCEDFYAYSCGGWIEQNPLPDGKSIWGPFAKLWQDNQFVMKNVLEQQTSNQSKAEEMSRTYYRSCLDKNETIEKLGSRPMISFLEKIGGWNISGSFDPSTWDFQKTLETVHNKYNRGGLFSWGVETDAKNSTRNIIQIDQNGLSLPSRDYYLNKSDDDEVLQALKTFISKVGILLGGKEKDVQKQVKDVLEFETRLAEITIPAENRTDDERMYKRVKLIELQTMAPAINWQQYFSIAFHQINYSIADDELIGLYSAEYLSSLSDLIIDYNSTYDKRCVLANYIGWSVVQSLIPCLSKSFREASKILRKALIGSEGTEPSWRYCVTDTNGFMGFALGAMFVKSVFKGESKPTAEAMIEQIRNAFELNLPNLKWMDAETRKLAKEKADSITEMIGFPDFILNSTKLDEKYEGLEFDESSYFENNIRVNEFVLKKMVEQILRPANRSEWEMTPSTVNAYYTPTKDTMVFPAGILQKPFYDVNYPKSVNFGAMGVVMGHELTHAFDNRGRKYDKHGNLHQWWDNNTISNFEEQIKCFVEQYSSYKVGEEYVNGERTLGENLADNGGLKAAFHAYQSWSRKNLPEPSLPGVNLTSTQIFFVRFAQVWCYVATPEALKLQVLNDPHSPHRFRVIGTLSNSKEFAETFNCPNSSPMNPTKKCEVW